MTTLTNPIIARELITQLRIPRSFLTLFSLMLIAGVVFCIGYASSSQQWTIEQHDGRGLFFPIVYFSLIIAIPIAINSANSIVKERESESLDLLLTTPMQHREIIWGKFIASVLYSLFILFALLPFVSISFIIGGLSFNEVAQCLFALLGFYCSVVMIGVTVSLLSVDSNVANRYTILAIILCYLGPFALRILLMSLYNQVPLYLLYGLDYWFNPAVAIFTIQMGGFQGGQQAFDSVLKSIPDTSLLKGLYIYVLINPGIVSGVMNLMFTAMLLFLTSAIFRKFSNLLSNRLTYRRMRKPKPKKNWEVSDSQGGPDSYWIPYFALNRIAMLQKETKGYNSKFLSRDSTIVVGAFLVTIGISWLSLSIMTPEVKNIPTYLVYYMNCIFGVIIVALFSPLNPCNSVLVEHRSDSWPLLRTSIMPSSEIVWGKVFSGFRQSVIPYLTIVITYYVTFHAYYIIHHRALDRYYFFQSIAVTAFFLVLTYFYSALGVYYSSRTGIKRASPHRKTYTIVGLHFFLPYLVYVGIQMVFMILFPMPSPAMVQFIQQQTQWFEYYILPISPIWLFQNSDWGLYHYVMILSQAALLAVVSFGLKWLAGRWIELAAD